MRNITLDCLVMMQQARSNVYPNAACFLLLEIDYFFTVATNSLNARVGSVVISIEKNIELTGNYLKITILSSIMFSLDYIFSKFVFLSQPFLQGIIWIRLFVFLFVSVFLLSKNSRKEIFSKQIILNKKTQAVFLYAQACGGAANFLQSFAISLAPIAFLAIVNSLRGIQYVFLFLITLFISYFYPRFLKEELSRKIIIQKVISIILIAVGLAILVAH